MSRLYGFIATAGICAVSGAIAGAFAGGLFGLVEFVTPNPAFPRPVLLAIAVGLSLIAWLGVLVIVGMFGNYGVLAIASRSLVTCVATGILTVLLVHATNAGLAGMLLGWILGFVVGKAFCQLCTAVERRAT